MKYIRIMEARIITISYLLLIIDDHFVRKMVKPRATKMRKIIQITHVRLSTICDDQVPKPRKK